MDVQSLIQTFVLMNMKDIMPHIGWWHMVMMVMYVVGSKYDLQSYLNRLYRWLKPEGASMQLQMVGQQQLNGMSRYHASFFCESARALVWKFHRTQKNWTTNHACTLVTVPLLHIDIVSTDSMDRSWVNSFPVPSSSSVWLPLDDEVSINFTLNQTSDKKQATKDEEQNINATGTSTMLVTNITVIVKTKSQPMVWLTQYIKNLIADYDQWNASIYNSKTLYVSRPKDKDSSGYQSPYFSSFTMSSTKSFDSLFFEGKESILARIEEYNDISKYKRIGLPHTLGRCSMVSQVVERLARSKPLPTTWIVT